MNTKAKLMRLMQEMDTYARRSTGYQPDKGMFWFTVEEVEKRLKEIRALECRFLEEQKTGG